MRGRRSSLGSRHLTYTWRRMNPHEIRHRQPAHAAAWTMNMKLGPGWIYGALIIVLAGWILHSFLQALLAACVTAIVSWPLYMRFAALLPRRIGRSTRSLIFTCAMSMFVLVPLMFAFGALLTEAQALLVEIAAADKNGIAIPRLAAERAPDRTLGGHALAERARSPRSSPRLDAANRCGCTPWLGTVARTVHGPTRVHHRIHDPHAVLPLSGR